MLRANDEAGLRGALAGCWLGRRGLILERAGGFRPFLDSGSAKPRSGTHNQHQTAPAPRLGVRHEGAAPSRGGAGAPQAASCTAQRVLLPERERSPGRAPPRADPPSRGVPLTAPAHPRETPRLVVPRERCAQPLQRAAARGLLGPQRQERFSRPESRASTPTGGAPPSA